MKKLSIDLIVGVPGKDEQAYTWDIISSPISILWFKLLSKEIKSSKIMHFRHSGLETKRSNLNYFIKSMNLVLQKIKLGFEIDDIELPLAPISRNTLNDLHHIFEGNHGGINNETEQFKNASEEARTALCTLNHLVHDYEMWDKRVNQDSRFFSIIGEIYNPLRIPLPSSFETNFTLNIEPGTMILHYGVVGKQWHEVYIDKDDVIPEEAIVPLELLSGEFDIMFADNIFDQNQKEELKEFLLSKGLDPDNHDLRIGVLPLAIPRTKNSIEDWAKIFSSNKILRVELKSDEVKINELKTELDYESPFTSLLKIPNFEENES